MYCCRCAPKLLVLVVLVVVAPLVLGDAHLELTPLPADQIPPKPPLSFLACLPLPLPPFTLPVQLPQSDTLGDSNTCCCCCCCCFAFPEGDNERRHDDRNENGERDALLSAEAEEEVHPPPPPPSIVSPPLPGVPLPFLHLPRELF